MIEKLDQLRDVALEKISETTGLDELETARSAVMGRKGALTILLKELGKLEPEKRREVGQHANKLKEELLARLDERAEELLAEASVITEPVDLTLPGIKPEIGGLHPIQQIRYDLDDAFLSLGFEVFQEDDITSELYGFDHLNFPPDHPARESMDTYWLKGSEGKSGPERLALRPHLTGASVRYLQKHGAPARFVYPGRVYRNEQTDARHERAFFQYEALIVDKDFSFASGMILVETILEKVFGRSVEVRMRVGFFPFVEPGFEIDMQCQMCLGEGCRLCQHIGWIEVMPGGSPHPNVLRAAGLDPDVWSGFYVNIGLDRLVMMRYGVDDVRLFHSADLRFLRQFR